MIKEIVIKWCREVIPYILIILVVLLIRKFIVTPVRVNGTSMEPHLKNGDILILEKMNLKLERFDIIVLLNDNDRLVKRVIGLPGETVNYKDNKLFINNKEVKEDIQQETYDFYLEDLGFTKIPEDYYFVMGDNRTNSVDSRYIGLVSINDILGTVRLRIFPFNKIGSID
jgi:signal peptidase I